ncbi:Rrp1b [Acrasis kona]|uniref:Rrp1b n=1 Tax=Acrasis kona TaxID=1008807 RepID=A0AAW2ZCA6_9EUKA
MIHQFQNHHHQNHIIQKRELFNKWSQLTKNRKLLKRLFQNAIQRYSNLRHFFSNPKNILYILFKAWKRRAEYGSKLRKDFMLNYKAAMVYNSFIKNHFFKIWKHLMYCKWIQNKNKHNVVHQMIKRWKQRVEDVNQLRDLKIQHFLKLKCFKKWTKLHQIRKIENVQLLRRSFGAWHKISLKFTKQVPRQFYKSIFFRKWILQMRQRDLERNELTFATNVHHFQIKKFYILKWLKRARQACVYHMANQHYLKTLFSKVIISWKNYIFYKSQKLQKLQKADLFYDSKLRSLSLTVSTERIYNMMNLNQKLPNYFHQSLILHKYKLLVMCLDGWREQTIKSKLKMNLMTKALQMRRFLLKLRFFEMWRRRTRIASHVDPNVHHHHYHHYHHDDDYNKKSGGNKRNKHDYYGELLRASTPLRYQKN